MGILFLAYCNDWTGPYVQACIYMPSYKTSLFADLFPSTMYVYAGLHQLNNSTCQCCLLITFANSMSGQIWIKTDARSRSKQTLTAFLKEYFEIDYLKIAADNRIFFVKNYPVCKDFMHM